MFRPRASGPESYCLAYFHVLQSNLRPVMDKHQTGTCQLPYLSTCMLKGTHEKQPRKQNCERKGKERSDKHKVASAPARASRAFARPCRSVSRASRISWRRREDSIAHAPAPRNVCQSLHLVVELLGPTHTDPKSQCHLHYKGALADRSSACRLSMFTPATGRVAPLGGGGGGGWQAPLPVPQPFRSRGCHTSSSSHRTSCNKQSGTHSKIGRHPPQLRPPHARHAWHAWHADHGPWHGNRCSRQSWLRTFSVAFRTSKQASHIYELLTQTSYSAGSRVPQYIKASRCPAGVHVRHGILPQANAWDPCPPT